MRHPIETVLTHLEYQCAVRRSFERDIATVCIVEILGTLMSYYRTVSSRDTTIVFRGPSAIVDCSAAID